MSQVYRGTSLRAIRHRIPKNLVVFDGQSHFMCAQIQFVLERNFTFNSESMLERNKMLFASVNTTEGREIERHFPICRDVMYAPSTGKDASEAGGGRGAASKPNALQPHALVLIEKVPSRRGLFLQQSRIQSAGGLKFTHDATSTKPHGVTEEDTCDIRVSIKFTAACRIFMKLDRISLRWIARVAYMVIPRSLGDVMYDKYVANRTRILERSAADISTTPAKLVGFKERQWKPRAGA